jgi:hypothetical protein
MPLFHQSVVGLGDVVIFFLIGGEVFDLIGHTPSLTRAIRRFDEAELVDAGVGAEGVDQTDVRTFRRLNRADTTIVRG